MNRDGENIPHMLTLTKIAVIEMVKIFHRCKPGVFNGPGQGLIV